MAAGLLWGFYSWGQWVSLAAVVAYVAARVWWVAKYSKQRPPPWRLTLVGIGSLGIAALVTLAMLPIGWMIAGVSLGLHGARPG